MYTIEISVALLDVQTRVCTPVTQDSGLATHVIELWRKHLTPSHCDFVGVILSEITFNSEKNKIVITYDLNDPVIYFREPPTKEELLSEINHMLAFPDDDEDPHLYRWEEFLNRRKF